MRAMMAVKLRRDNMQAYQVSLITSPTRQVRARIIAVAQESDAQDIIKQIQGGADFAKLAAEKSLDDKTKSKGGELGWLARGQYTKEIDSNLKAVIDNWLSDPVRKAGDLSPDLYENGTHHVVQIEEVDPSRPIDAGILQELKDNALVAWLLSQKEAYHIAAPDAEMLSDPTNMPSFVPMSPPQQNAPMGIS
jgi:hypothetical protein